MRADREIKVRCSACGHLTRIPTVTNADRIRAMTDEELAEWASIREMCFIYHLLINDPDLRNKCRIYENCKDCWLEWLKQEVSFANDDN